MGDLKQELFRQNLDLLFLVLILYLLNVIDYLTTHMAVMIGGISVEANVVSKLLILSGNLFNLKVVFGILVVLFFALFLIINYFRCDESRIYFVFKVYKYMKFALVLIIVFVTFVVVNNFIQLSYVVKWM